MTTALGIDTGGTYTDAALVDHSSGQVLSTAKALTTRRDLSVGIGQAVDAVFRQPGAPMPSDVSLVALSTTLATNAIVEGKGSPVCLVLIGYDPELINQYGFEDDLATDDVVYIGGGHDIHGAEAAPLDEAALRAAVLSRRSRVEAFAVSSYFGVRNPAHELRSAVLIEELTGLPVTCGHDLTTRLNSVRRATMAALNARLVAVLQELIGTLRRTLTDRLITAPLMVVKGDGSLVRAEWAMQRPIETILSGPAASAVGAWHLAHTPSAHQQGEGLEDGALWVVDVGGTTTDIAALQGGRPRLNPEGARVGRWRTMVEAVDVHTVGLGGDSHVRVTRDHRLVIGPQRVVPLSMLASQHPEVLAELRSQIGIPTRDEVAAQFLLARRPSTRPLDKEEASVFGRVVQGPVSLSSLVRDSHHGLHILRCVERMIAEHLLVQAGFTPTDALHAMGRLGLWNVEAAQLGARVLSTQGHHHPDELCRAVVEGVSHRAAAALVGKALSDEVQSPVFLGDWDAEPTAALLLERALTDGHEGELGYALTLRRPIVAIGAPVQAYMPSVSQRLHTRLHIPSHAEVASAVGAVAGGVIQSQRVLISPLDGGETLRLHLPQGPLDFGHLSDAVAHAHEQMVPWMEARAREAGAAHVEVQMIRHDKVAQVRAGWGEQIYLGTELVFTAAGRPSPAIPAG